MTQASEVPLSIVIPTYCREQVLLDSVRALLALKCRAAELLVVDQTPNHEEGVAQQLGAWDREGEIRLIKLQKPSITYAMNKGLQLAQNPLVLFLDDDIAPSTDLILRHYTALVENDQLWATVGQVIQPWQRAEALSRPDRVQGLEKDFDFPFNSSSDSDIQNVMAGNLCVKRDRAVSIGGFDEHFIGVAYRFETDFARRLLSAGGKIRFIGSAGIHHLRAGTGGTRVLGDHLTSSSPLHGMGDYYYAFRHGRTTEAWGYSLRRMFREIRTKFHLTHPWWIPVKLTGEVRAFHAGRKQARLGPKLLDSKAN